MSVSDIGTDLPPFIPTSSCDLQSIASPPPPSSSEDECRLKYVDDLSLGECVKLHHPLKLEGNDYVFPPVLSQLQKRLDDINISTRRHDMKLNLAKTKVMSFNFSKKYKFETEITIQNESIEVIHETKLLGHSVLFTT